MSLLTLGPYVSFLLMNTATKLKIFCPFCSLWLYVPFHPKSNPYTILADYSPDISIYPQVVCMSLIFIVDLWLKPTPSLKIPCNISSLSL